MLVFGENNSRRLSNFLQTHILWKFDHISRTCNQINCRNIWFAKVTIILIMTAQVLFFDIFSEKDPHLNAVENRLDFNSRKYEFFLQKDVFVIKYIPRNHWVFNNSKKNNKRMHLESLKTFTLFCLFGVSFTRVH